VCLRAEFSAGILLAVFGRLHVFPLGRKQLRQASGEVETMGRYVDVYRLYKRGEITLRKEALAGSGEGCSLSAHSFIENASPAGAHCSGWQEGNGADLAVASSGLKRPTGPLPFSHSGLAAIVVPMLMVPMIAIPTVVVPTAMASVPTVMAIPPNFLNGISLGHFDLQSIRRQGCRLRGEPERSRDGKSCRKDCIFHQLLLG
jgi:hypothetical protein